MQRKTDRTPSMPPAAAGPGADSLIDQIIDRAPVGMAVIAADGRYRRVNPAYCSLYGYTADALLGSLFTRVIPPERQARALAGHQAFLAGQQAMEGEIDVRRSDASVLNVLLKSVRMPGPDGQAQRLVYVVDITERARIERALQASQLFLQSVLDGLPAHVCVLDEHGTVVAANRAWRAFGDRNGTLPGRSSVGSNYLAVCDQAARAPQPAAAAGTPPGEVAAQLRAVLAGASDGFQAEYPCDTVDGPKWFLARISRIAGSQPPRTVVAHDDISALKQAQDTLRDGQALLLDMAASIPGAMFRLLRQAGGHWCFTYFSPGLLPLFGLTPAEACADIRALGRAILAEDRTAHDATIRAAVAAGRAFEQEYRIRTADGALKWVHATATPQAGQAGATVWTGLLTDISARKQLESVVRDSEERYRTLFETVAQGVVYQDAAGRITSANPAAQRILGLTLAQMMGRESVDPRWQAVREDGSPFPGDEHPAMVALRGGAPVHQVVMGVQAPGGGCTWLLVNATPVLRGDVVQEVYSSFEDITERVLLSQELKLQASTDDLTGVANRRSLMQRLALEFDRVQHLPAHRCALLAVDLDLFKQVNDRHGHAAGDTVLQHVATLMRNLTRQHDLVARSGGEEFTLLLPDTGADEAAALAERLRAGLQAQPARHAGPTGDMTLPVTVSVGVSLILPGDASLDAALARADAALYQAKADGRNRVCVAPLPG
jgi:diguanylate cyclase (GGDEF)-like protein/PAS domain S-box-containing protein